MQLVAAHVLETRRIRRSSEKRREVLDPLHIVMLGLRRELADRHVFDHAPAQRAHCLVGHGDAPVLSERFVIPSSQDRTPRRAIVLAASPAAGPYRASGLEAMGCAARQWHHRRGNKAMERPMAKQNDL